MNDEARPEWFNRVREQHGNYIDAVEKLGQALRDAGPLDEKSAQLVQLGAAAAIRSEGAVHSHCRRAMDAGASSDEVFHALILLTSTIGFPNVSAALSWADDVVRSHEDFRYSAE